MSDLLDGLTGVWLSHERYSEDLGARDAAAYDCDSWKFERQQHFRESYVPSWAAFARGEWDESLRLMESMRGDFVREVEQSAERRVRLLRVRVVEKPITPYLRWELPLLRIRAECGELIRVVGPEAIADHEADGPLPEILTLGPDAFYEISYDESGECDGAVRYLDIDWTKRVSDFIERLYGVGEDIGSFYEREVAHLEPPRGE